LILTRFQGDHQRAPYNTALHVISAAMSGSIPVLMFSAAHSH